MRLPMHSFSIGSVEFTYKFLVWPFKNQDLSLSHRLHVEDSSPHLTNAPHLIQAQLDIIAECCEQRQHRYSRHHYDTSGFMIPAIIHFLEFSRVASGVAGICSWVALQAARVSTREPCVVGSAVLVFELYWAATGFF